MFASEYFASEDPQLFWSLSSCLLSHSFAVSLSSTEKFQHDVILSCAETLLPGGATEMLKLSLATRYFSPALEAYSSFVESVIKPEYERKCQSFVEIGGTDIVCDAEELRAADAGTFGG